MDRARKDSKFCIMGYPPRIRHAEAPPDANGEGGEERLLSIHGLVAITSEFGAVNTVPK